LIVSIDSHLASPLIFSAEGDGERGIFQAGDLAIAPVFQRFGAVV
jgi:hypothetical protein